MPTISGKEIRLGRLFRESRKLFAVPLDHGVTLGPIEGLADVDRVVQAVIEGGADAVIVHKGLARRLTCLAARPNSCELILHLSASTILGPDPNQKELVSSVERAVQLGATAVSAQVNLGSAAEAKMLKEFGLLAEECERWGMPLLAMMYVRDGNKESEFDAAKVGHAARVAEELGADIIKVNYTGSIETFAKVVGAVRAPVVIAGGPKMDSPARLLAMVKDAIVAGARGVAIGRNLFQATDPSQLAAEIRRALDSAV